MHRFHLASAEEINIDLLGFVKGHVRSAKDASLPWENWQTAMDNMGIKRSLQQAVMDPDFENLRVTQSAMYWVLDTLVTKYMYLKDLDKIVLGLAGTKRRNEGDVQLESGLGQSSSQSTSTRGGKGSLESESAETPTTSAAALHTGTQNHQVADNETELLKGGAQVRLMEAIRTTRDPPNIYVNRLQNIYSAIPGDFLTNKLYIAQDREMWPGIMQTMRGGD